LRKLVVPALLLLLIAVAPVDAAMHTSAAGAWRLHHVLASVAGLLALLGAGVLLGFPARVLLVALVPLAVSVRALYAGLLHFSGQGFTDEVFLHLAPEAVDVAWDEYRWTILALALALLLCAGLALRITTVLRTARRTHAVVLLALAIPVLAWSGAALPEVQLTEALSRWYFPNSLPLSEERLQRWRASGLLELDLLPKHQVNASAPESPRNLVLLFIESGGVALARHPQYPDLMPNLHGLLERHALVPNLHASAYITIEGLVNAMCGTLFPFRADSEELAGAERLAEWMPCLGDVLAAAGYEQSYMGGAGLAFAGKGAFLKVHGYDWAKGIAEWRAMGMDQRPGTWGLSDADLFEQSHVELQRLRALGKPFNLTLLTIGMHVPGYSYEECTPYGSGEERFLNAASCTDQLLGIWLERLQLDGVLDDTVVVITADHHVFPNPEMKRLFGEKAVLDRRLPLVVLGTDVHALTEVGASYDLAPTLLDLLDIEHNARFALGRSLLRPEARRDGFFRKYENLVHGKPAVNRPCEAPSDRVPSLPLSGCEKDELLELLALQNARFSLAPAKLRCDGNVGANLLEIPVAADEPFTLLLSGREQAHRFTRLSRAVDPSSPGLYLALFDNEGGVLSRRFLPPSEAADTPFPTSETATGALVVWRGTEEQRAQRPDWLPSGGEASHAWLYRTADRALLAESEPGSNGVSSLPLGTSTCESLQAGTSVARKL